MVGQRETFVDIWFHTETTEIILYPVEYYSATTATGVT